jgi:hypothetical protein
MSDQAIILELARPRQQPVANTNKDQYTVSVIAEGDPVLFRVRAKNSGPSLMTRSCGNWLESEEPLRSDLWILLKKN